MPSLLDSATTRNTGIRPRRTKPIALGIVHGRSGCPGSVCAGGGPERSSPSRRRGPGAACRRDGVCWVGGGIGDRALAVRELATSVYAIAARTRAPRAAPARTEPPRSGALAGPGRARGASRPCLVGEQVAGGLQSDGAHEVAEVDVHVDQVRAPFRPERFDDPFARVTCAVEVQLQPAGPVARFALR